MNRRNILKFVGFSTIAAAIRDRAASAPMNLRVPLSEGDSLAATSSSIASAFNQVGYLPSGEKVATVSASDTADHSFQIVPASTSMQEPRPVLQGKLTVPTLDLASGDSVALADFTGLTAPGNYRLVSHGRYSEPFAISTGVYREPLRLTMRAFYGQRCGCAVDLGGGYSHPPCHITGAYHATSGRQGVTPNHGGWHDAGDYGRYIVNSGLSTGTLLWAWELYPKALADLPLNIPESGGKLPDYLAEIRWNLEWMLSLQDQDGGVWHKQTSEHFCGFILPQQDQLTSYVIGTGETPYKSTAATADLAAVAAIAARCYGEYDAEFAARCLASAKRAWSWAVAHPSVRFDNPPGIGTGDYGDKRLDDEILWASAELWRTTGDRQYEQAFLAGVDALPPESAIGAPSWPNVAPMAYWTYLLAHTKGSEPLASRILKQTSASAQALVARRESSGYGNTLAPTDFIWGSNSVAANHSLLLLIAHHLQPDPQLLNAALGNLHYLLGRNCFGISWVTQVGTNPFQHPHHRPSAADGIAAPWPGLLSGGPNARPGDEVAKTLPKMPPMRMWIDDQAAYSLNEVAINWNAPLVFVLAAANALAT
jgi:endoglucanase